METFAIIQTWSSVSLLFTGFCKRAVFAHTVFSRHWLGWGIRPVLCAKKEYHTDNFVTSLSRRLKMRKSPRGEPAPRRRARTTTRAGWRRWGSSGGCCGKRAETAGGRRGRKQTATPSCWRGNRTEMRKPQTSLRARRRVSLSFIRSKSGRSSEVLTTWPASRDYRSKSLEMY